MKPLKTAEEADAALSEEQAILFKHNTDCPISANAHREMESFLSGGAQAPFYIIDIHESRDVSNHVAEKTGIQHESPQVIVVRGGRAEWSASRWEVTADALREGLGLAPRG